MKWLCSPISALGSAVIGAFIVRRQEDSLNSIHTKFHDNGNLLRSADKVMLKVRFVCNADFITIRYSLMSLQLGQLLHVKRWRPMVVTGIQEICRTTKPLTNESHSRNLSSKVEHTLADHTSGKT
jgi:hypothetical protein